MSPELLTTLIIAIVSCLGAATAYLKAHTAANTAQQARIKASNASLDITAHMATPETIAHTEAPINGKPEITS